jgi:hypothetical protein
MHRQLALWNGAMGLLAQTAVAAAMTPAALSQLYQASHYSWIWLNLSVC